jgi:hypothetical protein
MADLQFTVDTTPMAHSVDTAKGHLNAVTVAVTTMEAAVIATERKASQKICDNVDNGFYMLVKSQISQKAVAAYTEMTSKNVILLQLVKALEGVKRQMEADFNMISRRYAKLFGSLNKALETRIKELDRPAMRLAEIRKRIVFDKLKDDSSMVFSVSGEALPLAQTAMSGKLKQKTKDAMLTLSGSIDESRSYSEKVNSILLKDGDFAGDSDERFLPAIFFVSDSLLNPNDNVEGVYTAQSDVWLNTAPIVSEVNRVHENLSWTPTDSEEKNLVRREFMALCEKEAREERLSKEMVRLFDESSWEDARK